MKVKSLQFGKAMSAALFVLLLSVVGMKNALAQTQVATLQHGDIITAYYGVNALINAHTAAVNGDIITLSSGTFTKTDITKAITLHGAGCFSDTLGITPTFIPGDFTINVSNSTNYLTIEGVCFQGNITYINNLYNAKFIKCCLNSMLHNHGYSPNGSMVNDVQFINCLIKGTAEIVSLNNSVLIVNCVIATLRHSMGGSSSTYVNIYNSIIGKATSFSGSPDNLYLTNCIIGANTSGALLANSYANSCIEIGTAFSSSVQAYNCMSANSYSEIFESFNGIFSFDSDYFLKEEIAISFLGNDGTEVGIYGGAMPYNPRPSYLILNRCNVAPRSTVDGKLSVDIEVITSE